MKNNIEYLSKLFRAERDGITKDFALKACYATIDYGEIKKQSKKSKKIIIGKKNINGISDYINFLEDDINDHCKEFNQVFNIDRNKKFIIHFELEDFQKNIFFNDDIYIKSTICEEGRSFDMGINTFGRVFISSKQLVYFFKKGFLYRHNEVPNVNHIKGIFTEPNHYYNVIRLKKEWDSFNRRIFKPIIKHNFYEPKIKNMYYKTYTGYNKLVKQDFIYVITYKTKNKKRYYKIGASNNPDKRLKQLQTGNPFKLFLLSVYRIKDRSIEKLIHKSLKKHNLEGEWFLLDKKNLRKVIKIILKNNQLNESTLRVIKTSSKEFINQKKLLSKRFKTRNIF